MLGGGGYVAGPVGLAALARRIPLVLTEADSHLGITNRLLAPRARRVCLAFPIEGRDGRALRRDGPAGAGAGDRRRRRAGALRPRPRRDVRARLRRLARRAHDQRGGGRGVSPPRRFASCTRPARATTPRSRRASSGAHYDLRPYIEDFGEALAACDLCVARAGGSIFEIAAAGKPAILVPYPHASADHQTANARWMAEAGAAVVVPDAELTPARLGNEVGALLGDPSRLAAMASASAALARPDAAQAVADAVLAAAAAAAAPAAGRPRMSSRRATGRAGGCTSSASAAPG